MNSRTKKLKLTNKTFKFVFIIVRHVSLRKFLMQAIGTLNSFFGKGDETQIMRMKSRAQLI